MIVHFIISVLLSAALMLMPESACAAPAAPVTAETVSVTQTGFTATWVAVSGATGYQLDVATNPLFTSYVSGFTALDVANVTIYSVSGLNPGITYYYRIRAYDSNGPGQNSNISALVTLLATPSVPAVAAASSITQTGFTSSWAVAAGATGYRLDVATDAGFSALVSGYANLNVGNLTSYPVSGLTAGTTYYYRVRAYNNGGTSVDSNAPALVTLLAIPAAPAVTGAISVTQNSFTATWGAVAGATGYRLDVSTNSGFTTFVTGYNNRDVANVTSFNVSGLTVAAGSPCFYRVRAYNSGGTSINSGTSALVALLPIPAAPVTTPATFVTQAGFSANWGTVGGALSYQLDVATDSLFTSYVSGYTALNVAAGTSYPVSGLNPGVAYFYRIRAIAAGGTGVNSNVSALVTLPATPSVPVVTAATALSQTGFTAAWATVSGASAYQLDVATDSGFISMVSGYNNKDVGSVTSFPVTNLLTGTTYYYRVRAYNNGGTSVSSSPGILVTLPAIPDAPAVTGAVSVTQNSFNATWGLVNGASGYLLDVSTSPAFTAFLTGFNNQNVANVSSYSIVGLTAGITYYYRVRANNTGGTSANSVIAAMVTLPPSPAAPVATAASPVTQTGFTAKWNAVAGVGGYQLDVATDSAFTSLVAGYSNLDVGTATSYAVQGLIAGSTYFYRVRAYNNSGSGNNSNSITIATLPVAPVAVNATVVSQTGFTANWGSVVGAVSYRLDVATDPVFASILTAYNDKAITGIPIPIMTTATGLAAGTTYYYRVRAVTAGGSGASSNVVSLVTLATPAAIAATNIAPTSFTANWGAAIGVVDYRLDVSTSSTFASFFVKDQIVSNATSFDVTGLSPATVYYYRVRSNNGMTISANSNTVTQSTLATPTATVATSVSQTVFTATWASAGGASGYRLDVATDLAFASILTGFNNQDVGNVTSVTVNGLTAGVTYYYRVRAYTSAATSGNSNIITQTTLATPVAAAATAITQTGFNAPWGTVIGATGYALDVATDAAFTNILPAYADKKITGAVTSTVTGLTAGTTYYYRVRSYNTTAVSASSNTITLTTIPPAPVASSGSVVTQNSFMANWNPALSATGYRLDVAAKVDFTVPLAGYYDLDVSNVTSYAVSGLTAGTTYYYRVRAVNSGGTSGNSTSVSQSTLAVPTATAATLVSQTGFTATWAAAGGASGYLFDLASDPLFANILTGYNNLNVGNITSTPVYGLAAGVTYYYRVRAYTSAATSINSNIITQITLATPVAAAATAITQTGFKAAWGIVGGATGYLLDVATDSAFTSILAAYDGKNVLNVTSYTVSGLTAGTVYYYRVRSFNSSSTSTNSNVITFTTIPPAPLASSGTLVTQTGFTANWTSALSATGYQLDVATNSTFTVPVTGYNNLNVSNVTSYAISGLTVGATYYYRVRSVNTGGTSGNSNVITQATLTIPTAIAATFVTQTSFNATWTSAGGATGYLLDVATDSLFANFVAGYNNLDVGNVTSSPVSGLAAGVTYYYRLRAYTSAATTGNSNVITQITLATPVATAAASVTQTSFNATWVAVIGATGYRLDVATDPTFTSLLANYSDKNVLNVTSAPVNGLATGASYYYRVRAFNATATTINSNVINPTTFPAVPVASAATSVTQTGFIANWIPSAGATGYRLDVATNSAFGIFVEGFNDLDVKNVYSCAVSGLTAGVTYYYRIRSYNIGGTSVSSAPSITQATVPPAPVATAAATITQAGFKAAWTAATGANGYMLDVALDAGFGSIVPGYSNLNVAIVTSFAVSGLTPGTDYFYRVRAFNAGGISENSNVIYQSTLATPVATAATSVFQTGFTATWGAVSGVTTYKLDVATNSSFNTFVNGYNNKDVGVATGFAVSGLTSGTVYYYRVRGVRDGATSTNSNVISQATLATPVATAAATISQTGFSASWNPALAATGYLLDVAVDSAFSTILASYSGLNVGNATSVPVSGLSPGTAYYYRVRAVGSGGVSTNSNTITLTMQPATPAPPVPAAASAVTQYAFTANWSAVSGATGYRLDVATDSGFAGFVSGYNNRDVVNAASSAISGLAAGTTYFYRVRAYNTGGTSASSATVSQTTLPPTPPATPVVAAASALTSSGFTANWSAVVGADGYVLDVASDAAFAGLMSEYTNLDVGNVTSFAVSGLASGSIYFYRVRARNLAGTSSLSSTVAVTTKPAPPLALPAVKIATAGFSASWEVVSGATGYQIDVSKDSGFSILVAGYSSKDTANVTSYPIGGLTAGTTYYYRVRAYNLGGVGSISNVVSLVTLPVAPVDLSAQSVTRTGFNAVWGIVSGAAGYLLDVATDLGFTGFVTGYTSKDAGNVTSSAVSGLTAGTTYYYRVRAYTSGGIGAYSNTIIQATLPAVPPAPVATSATSSTQTGITANWSPVYGATGYRIDVSSTADFLSFVVGYNNFDVRNTSSVDIIGLTPGSNYYFRIRSYNSGGSSENSNSISAVTLSAPLTVTINGSGGGSVHSDTGGIACISGSSGNCSVGYDGGGQVALTAIAESSSIFSGWAGACSGTADCLVTMDSAKGVSATFNFVQPVRILDPVAPSYFATLQAAYNAATSGSIIQLRAGALVGDLLANRPVSVTITGGFDAAYSENDLDTQLQGTVKLQQGTVRLEKVKLHL